MTRQKKELLAFGIAVVMMCLLFLSSNQPYQQQTVMPLLTKWIHSPVFEKELLGVSFVYGGDIISIETIGYYKFLEFFIRKAAHFTSFFIIGFCLTYGLSNRFRQKGLLVIVVLAIALGYATFDEYHQSLTPNRTPLIDDVLLDTMGAFSGSLVCLIQQLVTAPKGKIRQKRRKISR